MSAHPRVGAPQPRPTTRKAAISTEHSRVDVAPAVGETVVYAGYGVGRVVARERTLVAGVQRECLVVDLAAGLRVSLPLDHAAGRLRAVADAEELEVVQRTLAAETSDRAGPWTRRIRDSKAKLAGGRTADLAELVRDGGRGEHSQDGVRLSPGERRVYLQARQLLVREISSARGVDQDEADAWIEAQIVAPLEEKGR